MNILITGGAGFIGSHLSAFLMKNNRITIIDNLHPYYAKERKLEQLHLVKDKGTFSFYQEDLLDYDKTHAICSKGRFDAVVHLAALPGVAHSIEQPLDYVDYDIKATINVLKAAGETGVKKVIFASSSSVYGEAKNKPLSESDARGKVVSPYAASKYGAESFCHAYQSLYGFNLTILRFFTVYGPWGRPDMAITKFIHLIQSNKEIEVYGKNTSRDYTYIDDIVEGIAAAIQFDGSNEIFNIGAGHPISMDELLSSLAEFFPDMKVKRMPFRQGDVTSTWADITKARKLLGYVPKVSFDHGLRKTIEWMRRMKIGE